jgi:putrescine transport system ATP-binding protein
MLLLDEPMAALDKKLREETQFELMALQQSLGMTFLIVTHDQEEAMITADRIAVMRAGQIVQIGRPAEVYEAPNSRYVADFIGDVNLFEAKVTQSDDNLARLATATNPAGFEALADAPLPAGSTVWLAVRPEKIAISLDQAPAGPNHLTGRVADIGYLGDWTIYVVELDGGRTVRAARANASRLVDRPIDWDDMVWLSFNPDAAVVLTS